METTCPLMICIGQGINYSQVDLKYDTRETFLYKVLQFFQKYILGHLPNPLQKQCANLLSFKGWKKILKLQIVWKITHFLIYSKCSFVFALSNLGRGNHQYVIYS